MIRHMKELYPEGYRTQHIGTWVDFAPKRTWSITVSSLLDGVRFRRKVT